MQQPLLHIDPWIAADAIAYILVSVTLAVFVLVISEASEWRYKFDDFREEMRDELNHLDPKNPPAIHLHYAENHYRGRKWEYLWNFGALPSCGLLLVAFALFLFDALVHPIPLSNIMALLLAAIAFAWFGWIAYVRARHQIRYEQLTEKIELKHFTDNFETKLKTGERFLIRVYWNVNEGANDAVLVNAITAQLAKACATREKIFTLSEAQQFFDSIAENPPPLTDLTLFVPEILDISSAGISDEDHDVSIGTF